MTGSARVTHFLEVAVNSVPLKLEVPVQALFPLFSDLLWSISSMLQGFCHLLHGIFRPTFSQQRGAGAGNIIQPPTGRVFLSLSLFLKSKLIFLQLNLLTASQMTTYNEQGVFLVSSII